MFADLSVEVLDFGIVVSDVAPHGGIVWQIGGDGDRFEIVACLLAASGAIRPMRVPRAEPVAEGLPALALVIELLE